MSMTASERLAEATRLYKEARFPEIITLYSGVDLSTTDVIDDGIVLSQAHHMLNNYPMALKYIQPVLKKQPENTEALMHLANIYTGMEQHFMALDIYNRVELKKEKAVELYNNRGILYIKLKNYDAALQDFNTAIEINAEAYYSFHGKASVLYMLEKYQEALHSIDACIRINKNHAPGFELRCQIYAELGRIDDAIKDASASIHLSPSNPENYIRRGILLIEKKDNKAACLDFEMAKQMGNRLATELISKHCL